MDCVGAWDEYAECFHDSEAHNNKRCRLYKVSVAAANSGYACPYAHELSSAPPRSALSLLTALFLV